MPPLDTATLFFAAAVALALTPGPDNIFVLTQAALNGRLAGIAVTLGLCTGLLVHTGAVAIGVAAIFATSALAFTALKLVGAAYLLYLAWQAFRASASALDGDDAPRKTPQALYVRGIIMNVTNPKVAIFFLAFLPQFTDPAVGSIGLQVIVLGAIFMVATLLIFGGIALFSGMLGEWLQGSPRAQVIMNRVAGTVFVALAARLAIAER